MSYSQVGIDNAKSVASKVATLLGVSNVQCINVIATQAIREKGWAYWEAYPHVNEFNFWNVPSINGINLPVLASEAAGIAVYVFALLIGNPTEFAPFVDALRNGNANEAIKAISEENWAVPPYGPSLIQEYDDFFNVPVANVNIANGVDKPYVIVQKGQTLYQIANQYGVPIQIIKKANPQITNINIIDVGEKIYLC